MVIKNYTIDGEKGVKKIQHLHYCDLELGLYTTKVYIFIYYTKTYPTMYMVDTLILDSNHPGQLLELRRS